MSLWLFTEYAVTSSEMASHCWLESQHFDTPLVQELRCSCEGQKIGTKLAGYGGRIALRRTRGGPMAAVKEEHEFNDIRVVRHVATKYRYHGRRAS